MGNAISNGSQPRLEPAVLYHALLNHQAHSVETQLTMKVGWVASNIVVLPTQPTPAENVAVADPSDVVPSKNSTATTAGVGLSGQQQVEMNGGSQEQAGLGIADILSLAAVQDPRSMYFKHRSGTVRTGHCDAR